jgi:hypothetical protein
MTITEEEKMRKIIVISIHKCLWSIILGLLIIPQTILFANEEKAMEQNVATPFNAGEIIECVSHHPIKENDKIIIRDIVYEAFFDETGVVLRARETKGKAEDLVISIIGKPEMKDGKVVYQTEQGKIIFEGTNRGLKFAERSLAPHLPIMNCSGNFARLESEELTDRSRTGEFLIDTNIVYVSALMDQHSPSVAFDGTNYLVVWYDDRSGSSDITGARVSQTGTVLDTAGIAISMAANNQSSPSVAFDGTNYLVVWHDTRSGGYIDIYGARVNPAGTVLDPAGIAISTATYWQSFPSVTFDGTNYFVVWQDRRSYTYCDIYGARVNPAGTVLDPAGIAISTATFDQFYPSVAFDGTNYLVVWFDTRSAITRDIYGARVNPAGTVLDPAGIALSTTANNLASPSVAFDGTNYLVVWEEPRSSTSIDIYGARVSLAGTVIDQFAVSTQLGDQFSPALAHGSGDQLLITYSGYIDYINGHPAYTMRIWGKFYPFVGIEEEEAKSVSRPYLSSTIFSGHLKLPEGKKCRVFDITGRIVILEKMRPGIYFIEIDGEITSKVVKVR